MSRAWQSGSVLGMTVLCACSAQPLTVGDPTEPGIAVEIRIQCADDAGAAFQGDAGGQSASEAAAIWTCQRRCLEGCADSLCEVVSGLSVDVRRHCVGPAKPMACMPRVQVPADLIVDRRVCKTDPNWQTWAINPIRVPLGWYTAPYGVQAADQRDCELPACTVEPDH